MKKVSILLLTTLLAASACSDDPKPPGTTGDGGGGGGGGGDGGAAKTGELSGDVAADRTLTKDTTWLLKGTVFVKSGATLTIEKGTTIKGDNTTKAVLVVQPGGKIRAEGTADEPIVFTSLAAEGSQKAGDWGGVIILGNAPLNVPGGKAAIEGITTGGDYGGNNPADDSGVLRYVRIEYSGVQISPNNEVNGLTFGGVGNKTQVDHIQIRHTLDDCFEFFGGTVNAKYLACQYNQDDGLDFDFGYTGKIQFFVLQQDPVIADDTNGVESDNDANSTANTPFTEPTVYNATLCGHNKEVAKQQYGLLLRRNTKGHYANIVALGFEAGLDVRDATTKANAESGGIELKSAIFFGSVGPTDQLDGPVAYKETGAEAPNKDNDGGFNELSWFSTVAFNNATTDPGIAGCFDPDAPSFGPATSLTTNAATPPNDGFFDASAAYIGAFKDANDDWATKGKWAVWKK